MPDPALQPTATVAPPARPTPLPYAQPRRRRRWSRRVGWGLALAILVALGFWRGKPLVAQARYLWWQHRCMTYTRPPVMVVYEEDPQRAGALQGLPGYGRIVYDEDGKRGMIDGRLNDDDTVTLTIHDGPAPQPQQP